MADRRIQDRRVQNRRTNSRKRVMKGATIAYSNGKLTLPCVVRDFSQTGARLQIHPEQRVPNSFDLIVELDGIEVSCQLVWKKGEFAAVKFLTEPKKSLPKRQQIISPYSEKEKVSIRRLGKIDKAENISEPAEIKKTSHLRRTAVDPIHQHSIPILIAEDDPDDRYLIASAFDESEFNHEIIFAKDGEELLKYMRAEVPYTHRKLPGLILLDLNMPRVDGRTALCQLKADVAFRHIPVVVLTTSTAEEDIRKSYDLGVSAYVPKPGSYNDLVDLIETLNQYWTRFSLLPAA